MCCVTRKWVKLPATEAHLACSREWVSKQSLNPENFRSPKNPKPYLSKKPFKEREKERMRERERKRERERE